MKNTSEKPKNIHMAYVCMKCATKFGWIRLYFDETKRPCHWCNKLTFNRNLKDGEKKKNES